MNYVYGSDHPSSARTSETHAQSRSSSSSTPPPGRQETIRDFIRQRSLEHNLERSRASARSYQPRRRSSVIISNTNHSNQYSSSHASSLAPIGTATPTLSASPSRLSSTVADNTSSITNVQQPTSTSTNGDPWQTISDVMAATNRSHGESSRLRREHDDSRARLLERQSVNRQSEQLNRHDRLLRTSNPQRYRSTQYDYTINPQTLESARALIRDGVLNEDLIMSRIERANVRPRADGVYTMGIGWDAEGRNL